MKKQGTRTTWVDYHREESGAKEVNSVNCPSSQPVVLARIQKNMIVAVERDMSRWGHWWTVER